MTTWKPVYEQSDTDGAVVCSRADGDGEPMLVVLPKGSTAYTLRTWLARAGVLIRVECGYATHEEAQRAGTWLRESDALGRLAADLRART